MEKIIHNIRHFFYIFIKPVEKSIFLLFYNFLFLACYKIAGIHFQADKDTGPLKPVVEDLKNFIENDPDAYMFFNLMFEQVPAINPNRQLGYRRSGITSICSECSMLF